MALEQNEIKKVITVDLGNTTTSLKEYKKHIDELRGSLLQLDESSEEYAKIAQEIKNEQDKLNEVMKVGKKNTDAADGSYDKLVQTMAELKKQWKATADETERANIGKQINSINGQLKDLDASTGNFQRNVGDYKTQMASAFNSLPGPIGKVSGGVKGLGTQLKALLKNPLIAIVGAVTAAIGVLTKSIKGNEDQMMQLKEAFAVFEPVINLVKKAITQFAQGVVNVFTKVSDTITTFVSWIGRQARKLGFDEFADKIEKFEKMQQKSKEMAAEENRITKEKRDLEREIANTQREISELKYKANQSDKYSAEERKKFLEESTRLEIRAAEKTVALRKREYELIKWKNEQSQNSAADYDAENQALIAVTNAQTELNNKLSGTARRISTLGKQANETAKETINAAKEVVTGVEEEVPSLSNVISGMFSKALELAVQKAKDNKETAGYMKEWLTGALSDLSLEADAATFDINNDPEITSEAERQQALLDIKLGAMDQEISYRESYIEEMKALGMNMDAEEQRLAELKEKRRQAEITGNKLVTDAIIKDEQNKYKAIAQTVNLATNLTSDLFSAMIDMSEEGSEEQKKLQIAQAVINTIGGAAGAFLQAMATYPAPAGPIIGAAMAAVATATGIAQIAKMKATNKNSANVSSSNVGANVSTPDLSMTNVSPLLNEQTDLNRMTTLTVDTEQQQTTPQRVYVVESDITEAQKKVSVVEDNATF